MATDNESFKTDLYDLLKVRGYKPVPLNAKNQRVSAPQEAEVFEFTFMRDGKDYGKAWTSIDDNHTVNVYFDDEQADTSSAATQGLDYDDSWTGFLRHVKTWAQRRQLSFEIANKDRLGDDMRQREFYKMKAKTNVTEGYYPINKKSSYNDAVPNVKIILQHNKSLEEGEQRFRNVEKIFLENTDGERFLAPTNRPGLARVYARHLAEGGTVNDEKWNHIKSMCEEFGKMAGFSRAVRKSNFNEGAKTFIEEGLNHYNNLRETLGKLTGHRGYNAYFESWTPTLMETGEEDPEINEHFVRETLDPRIESVIPILSRIRKKVSEMSEVTALEEWAEGVINEKLELDVVESAEKKIFYGKKDQKTEAPKKASKDKPIFYKSDKDPKKKVNEGTDTDSIIGILRQILKSRKTDTVFFPDGTKKVVDPVIARMVLMFHDSIKNPKKKQEMDQAFSTRDKFSRLAHTASELFSGVGFGNVAGEEPSDPLTKIEKKVKRKLNKEPQSMSLEETKTKNSEYITFVYQNLKNMFTDLSEVEDLFDYAYLSDVDGDELALSVHEQFGNKANINQVSKVMNEKLTWLIKNSNNPKLAPKLTTLAQKWIKQTAPAILQLSKQMSESINTNQKKAGQLDATQKAKKISPMVGTSKDKKHPFNGKLVGANESADLSRMKTLAGISEAPKMQLDEMQEYEDEDKIRVTIGDVVKFNKPIDGHQFGQVHGLYLGGHVKQNKQVSITLKLSPLNKGDYGPTKDVAFKDIQKNLTRDPAAEYEEIRNYSAKAKTKPSEGISEAPKKKVSNIFKKIDYSTFERVARSSEDYFETEIDGKQVMAAMKGENCIALFYQRAGFASYDPNFIGDVMQFAEEDTNWPYN